MFGSHSKNINFIATAIPVFLVWSVQGVVFPDAAAGQTESGIIEKSLRQSRPEFGPPPEEELPSITVKDSRSVVDAGAGPSFFVRKIEITGNRLISDEELAPIVDIGDGLEMTLGLLMLIANEVTAHYAQKGFFLARAYVPEQEISAGVIKMKIVEGRVGRIKVTGNKSVQTGDLLKRMWRVRRERVLKEQTLEETLLELNDLMGVNVRSVLQPGDLPGTSDLVLEVTESRPYQLSFDTDNFGSRFTGVNRFGHTGIFGNLLTLGDQFSFRWVRSDQGQDFFNPSYIFPINRYGTKFKASYTFSENELGDTLKSLFAGGSSEIFSFELSQSLHRSRSSRVFIRGGLEFRDYENEQLGENTSKDNLHDFYLGLGGNYSDNYRGRNFYDVQVKWGFNDDNSDRTMASRAGGRGDVTVANFTYTRYQSVDFKDTYFILKGSGQITSARVLSPDQISLGGWGTVRGFPLSEISGDEGYNFSVEYVIPFPFDLSSWGVPDLKKYVSFIGFWDHGRTFVPDKREAADEKDQFLTGVGGGIKINVPSTKPHLPSVSFALTYGIPVMNSPLPSDRSFGIVYLSGLISF